MQFDNCNLISISGVLEGLWQKPEERRPWRYGPQVNNFVQPFVLQLPWIFWRAII